MLLIEGESGIALLHSIYSGSCSSCEAFFLKLDVDSIKTFSVMLHLILCICSCSPLGIKRDALRRHGIFFKVPRLRHLFILIPASKVVSCSCWFRWFSNQASENNH